MPVQIPTPREIIRKVNLGFMPFVTFKENVSAGAGARVHGGRRLQLLLRVWLRFWRGGRRSMHMQAKNPRGQQLQRPPFCDAMQCLWHRSWMVVCHDSFKSGWPVTLSLPFLLQMLLDARNGTLTPVIQVRPTSRCSLEQFQTHWLHSSQPRLDHAGHSVKQQSGHARSGAGAT